MRRRLAGSTSAKTTPLLRHLKFEKGVCATQVFSFADNKTFTMYLVFDKGVYSQII
tara:strand:- start:139 stop:306 length:168 start_codon:yes stop_codon:yes gene_type:complete